MAIEVDTVQTRLADLLNPQAPYPGINVDPVRSFFEEMDSPRLYFMYRFNELYMRWTVEASKHPGDQAHQTQVAQRFSERCGELIAYGIEVGIDGKDLLVKLIERVAGMQVPLPDQDQD